MSVSLDRFSQQLRPYQADCVSFAHERAIGHPGGRTLFVSPTGTGKGTIELALLKQLRADGHDAIILTPSIEILRGFLERCGASEDELDSCEDKLAALGESIGVHTPVRYRNQVLKGERQTADIFIVDEAHHQTEQGEISGLLFTLAPEGTWIGFTATGYRGTPKGTRELREAWGEPYIVLTVPEAIEQGCAMMPEMQVVPLVDDDKIVVRNGQFVVSATDKVVGDRIEQIIMLAVRETLGGDGGYPRPTVVVMPSTDSARGLVAQAELMQTPVRFHFIGQHVPVKERKALYEECRNKQAVLVVINVLGEGVDLPWLRSMIDASPTLSPVVWMQRIGRIMRPNEITPRYLCVCRNLERHAYLMQGAIPAMYIAQAQQAFEKPSNRSIMRVFGLEALKKFKQIDVPCANGVRSSMWVLYSIEGGQQFEYVAIVHPTKPETIVARRTNMIGADGTRIYAKWERCEVPQSDDFAGFSTVPFKNKCSDPQKRWWSRSARKYGLDPDAVDKLTARQFFALPVLSQLKESLW